MKEVAVEIEKDFDKIKFRLNRDGIMYITLKVSSALFTLSDLEETMGWIESLGNRKYLNLYEGDFSVADALVREKIASKTENKHTIADAFVIKNISDKMIGDFYMQFNKPCKPTSAFKEREEAVEWLLAQK